jgi:hypothetical protein
MLRGYKRGSLEDNPSCVFDRYRYYLYLLQLRSDIFLALIHSPEQTAPHRSMSTAVKFIPTFATITLLIGGFNKLGVQLTLVGILAIILHTVMTPTELPGPYPNFDNYHPSQPPLRDYVLVFGLTSLGLIALFSKFYTLVSGFLTFGHKSYPPK